MTLVHAKKNRDELLTSVNVRFAFDHVDKLREIHLDADDEGEQPAQRFVGGRLGFLLFVAARTELPASATTLLWMSWLRRK